MQPTLFNVDQADLNKVGITDEQIAALVAQGPSALGLLASILQSQKRTALKYRATPFALGSLEIGQGLPGPTQSYGTLGYQQLLPENPNRKSLIIACPPIGRNTDGSHTFKAGFMFRQTSTQYVSLYPYAINSVAPPQNNVFPIPPEIITTVNSMLTQCISTYDQQNMYGNVTNTTIIQINPAPTDALTCIINYRGQLTFFPSTPIITGVLLEGF